ncbi:MAG: ABC transporter permease [Phycisphaerales bacterium]|nr:ABC transporter permease [Phycisphaerales bacterium]
MMTSRFIGNVRLGIKTLLLHKMRSILTMLGMVFGVGAVIAMLAVGEGASKQALDQIRRLGSQNIIINSQKPIEQAASGSMQVRMNMYGLLYDDLARIEQSYNTIDRVVPSKLIRGQGRVGSRTLELRLVGTTPNWFELVSRDLLAGRVMTDLDMENFASVVVLTEHGARKLLVGQSAVGSQVRISQNYFTVIGVIKSESTQSGSMQTPDQDIDAYIPLNVAIERFGDITVTRSSGSRSRELVELHQLIVQVDSIENVESTAAGIERMLSMFHPKGDYRMSVPLALLRQAEATQRTFNIVLGSIAGISLLIGGIGIMNIMLASVTERTREIGIRRAIGARRKQIIGQFLIETVVLSVTGGFIGIGIGLLIPWLITMFADMPTIVTLWSVLLSVVISIGVGVIFGMYPAMRAANLDPIVALRHE